MHKWFPKVNKQKFTPKLKGGVAVKEEFVHFYKYSVVDLQLNGALLNTTIAPVLSQVNRGRIVVMWQAQITPNK